MQDAGKSLYEDKAVALSDRPYQGSTPDSRIEPFSADTLSALDLTRGNVGNYLPAIQQAFTSANASQAPVGAEDISRYMNPYTSEVANSVIDQMNRQAQRETLARHGQETLSGSFLNEDRRKALDISANEASDRNISGAIAKLYSDAFTNALGQANIERNRNLTGATAYGQLGEALQKLGYTDVAGLSAAGSAEEAKGQLAKDINYSEQQSAFNYPQEQLNWLLGILHGTPYNTTNLTTGSSATTTPQAASNPWGQALGIAAQIAGMFAGA